MSIRLGIDVDDVMLDTVEAWLQRHNDITGDDVIPDDIKSWDIAKYIKEGNRDTLFYILHQNDFWKTVQPKKDAVAYLEKLYNDIDDLEIYIVTATYPITAESKANRLFNLFPFIDERRMVMTASKGILDLDIMVDDNPKNLDAMKQGVVKVLFDAPHNRACDEGEIGAIRVTDWKSLYDYIKMVVWLEGEDELED